MRPISVGQLHRLTGKAIAALPGAVSIKSGDQVIALLVPVRDGQTAEGLRRPETPDGAGSPEK